MKVSSVRIVLQYLEASAKNLFTKLSFISFPFSRILTEVKLLKWNERKRYFQPEKLSCTSMFSFALSAENPVMKTQTIA